LYPDASIDLLLKNYSHCKFTIFGHTHYPFIHTHENKVLINPGSVGQPRDVGGLASYVIINTDNFSTRFKRLKFDRLPIIEMAKSRDSDLDYLWKIM
jgi:predicted phosphodiesterase